MNKREIKKGLKDAMRDAENVTNYEGDVYQSVYLGSFMAMDPCGRYHHLLSPNGITNKCAKFWENLESAAVELGGSITGGEGDPTDVYFEFYGRNDQ